jgi:hypothetical protein
MNAAARTIGLHLTDYNFAIRIAPGNKDVDFLRLFQALP